MTRVVVGLDLNGRVDIAARDVGPDSPDDVLEVPLIVSGGVAGDVVTTLSTPGQAGGGRRIAGPQARLAPHGRGAGWGEIGAATRRRALAEAVDNPAEAMDDVRAALAALARGADDVVLTVPDIAAFDESRQGAMLKAARQARSRTRVRLLWRSVAGFLGLMAQGAIPSEAVGSTWEIWVHGPAGMEAQRLTLVRDPAHPQHVAPRRDGPGRTLLPDWGLDAIMARAAAQVREANPGIVWDRCEPSRLGPALVVGEVHAGEREILRTWNGNWQAVVSPALDPARLLPGEPAGSDLADTVAGSFLLTPICDALLPRLSDVLPQSTVMSSSLVAEGALRAGRLIERGLPHYFDRIEEIRIAVLRDDGPKFVPLIGPDEVVPADREYVSPTLDGFVWQRGKKDVEFYILKGKSEIRHWRVQKDAGPDHPVPVSMRVRQVPGQSWARLTVSGSEWDVLARAPIALDWETIAPVDLTEAEVLEKLKTGSPGIPKRIVERSDAALWLGSFWAGRGPAASLARTARDGGRIPFSQWSAVIRAPRRDPDRPEERFWHVGTDGDLPPDLPDDIREGFAIALRAAEVELLSGRPARTNDALLFATWIFAACPEEVKDGLVEALEADARGRYHPWLAPASARNVVKSGAGRAVTGVERVRRVLAVGARSAFNAQDNGMLAALLSRRTETPDALTPEIVGRLAEGLGHAVLSLVRIRSFDDKFRNALLATAGLFRWREHEPHALLAARDPVASRLRDTLVAADQALSSTSNAFVRQRERKQDVIRNTIAFLDGGGDPDILRMIAATDEEEEA